MPVEPMRVYRVTYQDKGQLLASYMPYLEGGGLFCPKLNLGRIGDDVGLLVSVPGEQRVYAVTAKVVWRQPRGHGVDMGDGVQLLFRETAAQELKNKIESLVAGTDRAKNPTFTC